MEGQHVGLWQDIKGRFAPLAIFASITFLPIFLLAAVQSRTVFLWLYSGDRTESGFWFALLGAASLESTYIGLAAWADRQERGRWVFVTELMAMGFSMGAALYVYAGEGLWVVLHMCFPVLMVFYLEATRKRIVGATDAVAAVSPIAAASPVSIPVAQPVPPIAPPITAGNGYVFREPPIYTWSEETKIEPPKKEPVRNAKSEAARRGHVNRRLRQLEAEQKQPISMAGRG